MLRGAYLALVCLAAAAVTILFFQQQDLTNQGRDAHKAICALRTDLEQRVESGQNFLLTHPKGIPGIPASVIRNGLMNQQKTVDALSNLDC